MSERLFEASIIGIAAMFTIVFGVVVIPPLVAEPDVLGGFAAGFVNPYASGYSADVLACWGILIAWIVFETRTLGMRHGWVCVLLGVVPGVAVASRCIC